MSAEEQFANKFDVSAEEFDVVDKASLESFPASDPPSWIGGKPAKKSGQVPRSASAGSEAEAH